MRAFFTCLNAVYQTKTETDTYQMLQMVHVFNTLPKFKTNAIFIISIFDFRKEIFDHLLLSASAAQLSAALKSLDFDIWKDPHFLCALIKNGASLDVLGQTLFPRMLRHRLQRYEILF
ncbi:hypothetical protein Zmor_017285 [Zophobas morio]|uniref:Uncharacterized protein n=1 Tax=Zophobas morio TaxID=2755281 RepID=A0AA38MCE7_9CUCU|nr:hypothetical protein Zmor_017285 [Zophobas morio]